MNSLHKHGHIWACTIATIGCSFQAGDATPEDIASTQQEIANGSPLSPSDYIATNMVSLEDPQCSAVALNREWLLTANHCLPYLYPDFSSATLFSPPETRTVRELASHGWEDIALVRTYPFSPSTQIRTYMPWNGSMSSLRGANLLCAGQGESSWGGGDGGTWRTATLTPSSVFSSTGFAESGYTLLTNGSGQILTHGDSGGPCLKWGSTGYLVTGITSTGDGSSAKQVGLTSAMSTWVDSNIGRSRLFFYRSSNGAGYVSGLETDGTYTSQGALSGLGTQWTHVTVLRNGAVIFYNSSTGAAQFGRVEKNGTYVGLSPSRTLSPGFTHIVSVGPDRLFMFNATTGMGQPAKLSAGNSFTSGTPVYGFSPFTHITGTIDGNLFMYRSGTSVIATARIDATPSYSMISSLGGFSTDWTHIVTVNERRLMFYNSVSGVGWVATLTDTGYYSGGYLVSGIGSGYTSVVGATNGTLLYRDSAGNGRLAMVDAVGTYLSLSTLSGFSTNWTQASAE